MIKLPTGTRTAIATRDVDKQYSMSTEMFKRRTECLSRYGRGEGPNKWAKEIAELFGVKERAILKDWSRRADWIPKIMQQKDVEVLVAQLVVTLEQTRVAAWDIIRRVEKHEEVGALKAGVDALKMINESYRNQVEILQSMGRAPKVADQLDVRSQQIIVHVEGMIAPAKPKTEGFTEDE